jgi:hypothetical protein
MLIYLGLRVCVGQVGFVTRVLDVYPLKFRATRFGSLVILGSL